MTDCVTLWIGERLGPVERACMRSVLRQGHSLALYCYRAPSGIPEGVELRDAADVLPEQKVFRHRSGSFGMFSDWFRYELLRRAAGTWVDTDVYLLRPLDEARPYLFGEQERGLINNAVLRLPPESPVLHELLRPFEADVLPMGLRAVPRAQALFRQLISGRLDLYRLPWGSTGPHALTRAAEMYGLASEAVPSQTFYPVGWRKAAWIVDQGVPLDKVLSSDTVAIHLWNECIKDLKDAPAPKGSFLERLQLEGGA